MQRRHIACAAIGLLAATVVIQASELSDDLAARRARLIERLGSDSMLIVLSAPTRSYSLDIDYEYRQDSNLYYLTGLTQEGTILVAVTHSLDLAKTFPQRAEMNDGHLERGA